MSTTIIPGVQPVARVPAKVIVEMPLHEALVFACLEGGCLIVDSVTEAGIFEALCDHPRYPAYREVRDAAARSRMVADFSCLQEQTEELYG